jgi:hypothetical protein
MGVTLAIAMKVPRNVLWFEALLYASLMLDASRSLSRIARPRN